VSSQATELSRLHEAAELRLRDAGQRYTDQRRRLVAILSRAGKPLAIPEILRGRRQLALSSVYRNLGTLEQAAVVRRVITEEDFARYELAEDLTGHHHHLVCSRCGRVEDAALPPAFERALDRAIDELARTARFAAVSHRLDLIGLCRECAGDPSPGVRGLKSEAPSAGPGRYGTAER
jgi:Fe2+ or Zn2+ uptake regulation protein